MGMDIHSVWQRQQADGSWRVAEAHARHDAWPQDRDYRLFAWLGADRWRVIPRPALSVAELRGVPEDFVLVGFNGGGANGESWRYHPVVPDALFSPSLRYLAERGGRWTEEDLPRLVVSMGYYSFSWLLASEMIEFSHWHPCPSRAFADELRHIESGQAFGDTPTDNVRLVFGFDS